MAKKQVLLKTSHGDITIELFEEKSPGTVANFLKYVEKKFFNGLIFHRVISDFMIQGGGMKPDMSELPTMDPIKNEASNRISNTRGTIAMARTNQPHSATSQFFINVKDNKFLDYQGPNKWGYCVFGKVTKGLDIVDKIKVVKTKTVGGHGNVPITPVLIKEISLITEEKTQTTAMTDESV
ncbi:peptidylprolyl isomerase [Bacteriovoracaceae bacterium]|nr:peptidylprolyl isomerase [Bacteriovoracaceae bacterium]